MRGAYIFGTLLSATVATTASWAGALNSAAVVDVVGREELERRVVIL